MVCNTGVHAAMKDLWGQVGVFNLFNTLDLSSWHLVCENITASEGEQNVIFKSKHVHVCSETKCVWHSELLEHPVPIHTPKQVAGKNIPCSATVLAWLISCSLEQTSGPTSLHASSRTTWTWRHAMWQTRETLTILAAWMCSEKWKWDGWQIRSCQSH